MKTLFLIIIFGAVGFMFYMGMFTSYEVTEETFGPYKYVYEPYVGPYKDTGQVGMDVYNHLLEDGIETTLGLGIYYDNPKDVPAEELRSEMGSIIPEGSYEKLAELEDKYNVKDIPEKDSMVVRFPVRNMLSYMMGPMKVYPIMEKYISEMGYTVMEGDVGYELYDVGRSVIIYAMPINK